MGSPKCKAESRVDTERVRVEFNVRTAFKEKELGEC
jgi:hypothetical protein